MKFKEAKYDESEIAPDELVCVQKPPQMKNVNLSNIEAGQRFSLIGVALMMQGNRDVNEGSIIDVRVVSEGNEDQFKKAVKIPSKCLTEDNAH